MTRYSVQPKDRIFVKGYGFLSFAKNMGRNLGKNINKNFINAVTNFLIMLNNQVQILLKLLQKEQFQKQQRQLMI